MAAYTSAERVYPPFLSIKSLKVFSKRYVFILLYANSVSLVDAIAVDLLFIKNTINGIANKHIIIKTIKNCLIPVVGFLIYYEIYNFF